MISIPENIRIIAKSRGVKAGPVAHWLIEQLAAAGIAPDASPAEWPADVWAAYTELKGDVAVDRASASSLFSSLGVSGQD